VPHEDRREGAQSQEHDDWLVVADGARDQRTDDWEGQPGDEEKIAAA
jgi:hypothetical protein